MFRKLFKKKSTKTRTVEENMVYMASLGISPDVISRYKETTDKIKDFEKQFIK